MKSLSGTRVGVGGSGVIVGVRTTVGDTVFEGSGSGGVFFSSGVEHEFIKRTTTNNAAYNLKLILFILPTPFFERT